MTEPNRLTATEAARRISAGDLTSEALVEACAARIAEREDVVGAWESLRLERALEEARAKDREGPGGPLHGVPFGVKDIIDTAELPTRLGSPIFRDRQAVSDAAAVARLRAAGGVYLGKNVTTEFAYFGAGKTRNPHDPERTPGGSSSGSAAAVADFMTPLSLGTQAAGSTIRPASFCGAFGFKPSHDRWDMSGGLRLYPTIDTLSIFARAVEDAALVDSVLSSDGGLPEQRNSPPRIAFYKPAEWGRASAESVAVVDDWAAQFAAAGAQVEAVQAPPSLARLVDASDVIIHHEALENAGEILPHLDRTSEVFREMITRARTLPDSAYRQALADAEAARADWRKLMTGFDAALTVAVPAEAPVGLTSTGDPVFIRTFNVLRAPSMNLPLGTGPAGMPIGVQLAGVYGGDHALLSTASWLMRATA